MVTVAWITPIPSPFVKAVAVHLEKEMGATVSPCFFGDLSHRPTWGKLSWDGFYAKGVGQSKASEIYAELERLKPDIVLVSGYGHASYRSARSYALKNGVPFVPSLVEPPSPSEGLKRCLRNQYIRWFLRGASGIACMGGRASQEYSRAFQGPMIEAPYAFDIGELFDHPRPRIEGPSGLTFLYSGGLVERRAPMVAVRAFSDLLKKVSESIFLTISGRGPQEGEVRRLIDQLGIADSVIWKNDFEDWYDLMNLYRSSDVLLCPNRYNTWNLTIQEAMSSGMGVVATWTTEAACSLLVNNHNGFLVRPDNVDSLVRAMEQYYLDRDLIARHGSRSKEIVQTIDASQVGQRLACFLNALLPTK